MIFNLTRALCLLSLLAVAAQAAQDESTIIKGKVVDSMRQPVKDAHVTILVVDPEPANTDQSIDQLIFSYETSEDGIFVFHLDSVQQKKALLHVSTAVPSDVFSPFHAPFVATTGASLFPGKIITIDKEQEINVGELGVEVHFKTSRVLVQAKTNKATDFLNSDKASLCMRVRDERGDIVSSGGVPSHVFRKGESSFDLALPQGSWRVELSTCGSDGPWYSAMNVSGTRDTDADQYLTVMIDPERAINHTGADHIPAYSISDARQRLSELRISYNREAFIEHAGRCNTQAVQLFLAAGMSPNVTDKGRSSALIAAAAEGCSEVVRVLLDANANPNAANAANTSPLLAASCAGSLVAVKALLRKNASPNAMDNHGLTPLMLAAGNSHLSVVEALLAARADVNLKDKKGMTALDYAEQTSNDEVIRVLRLAALKAAK